MKNISLTFSLLLISVFVIGQNTITWYSWDEAVALQAKTQKKIFVDVYTEWCGWCKKMDSSTFVDPTVVKFMNDNFIAVKLDAEQKEDILWNGTTFKHIPGSRGGSNELAVQLLNGRMAFPSFVTLDEGFNRIRIIAGYKVPEALMLELKYAADEVYREKQFDMFSMGL